MTGHVQLRDLRVVDYTVVPEATMESLKEGDSLFEGFFRATCLWNGMVRGFRIGNNKETTKSFMSRICAHIEKLQLILLFTTITFFEFFRQLGKKNQ